MPSEDQTEGMSAASCDVAHKGLRRLAASAALIRASLSGGGFESGKLDSPEIRIGPDGEIEAWVLEQGATVEMFKAWPNKFGQLAFGFACDHFKMLHEAYWEKLKALANAQGSPVVVGSQPFGADASVQLQDAQPERMTAPALMALCQRMATAPGWLMSALDDLEQGRRIVPPKLGARKRLG